MTMSSDLRNYKDMVLDAMRRARATGAPEIFENSGPEHARVVLDVMLNNAERTLDVIAGQMDPNVWSVEALASFSRRRPNSTVRVLLDGCADDQVPDGSALVALTDHARVEVRRLPVRLDRHLCVADRAHVRLEYDKATREASITFGDPQGAGRQVTEIFNLLWNSASEPISFAPAA